MIRPILSKDKLNFIEYCVGFLDKFKENFITIDKNRKFLSDYKVSEKVFNNASKHGDKIYLLDDEKIKGLFIITGYSDKFPRKYLKILANTKEEINDLLKFIDWNFLNEELFLKLKLSNPMLNYFVEKKVFKNIPQYVSKGMFFVKGFRGKEILLVKPKKEIPRGRLNS